MMVRGRSRLGRGRTAVRPGVGVLCAAGALWLLVVGSVGGCSGMRQGAGNTGERPEQTAQPAVSSVVAAPGSDEAASEVARDPRELSPSELIEGPGVLELGVSKRLTEIGVLELLESYIINVPPTASFISIFETAKAWEASYHNNANAGAEAEVLYRFEGAVLSAASFAYDSVPPSSGSQVLHDAFFAVLEDCGRGSRWPEVELFVMSDGRGYDVLPESVEPSFGMSYFEYQQLKHECARLAASYPTLDEAVRDELLKPQREHYARAVIEELSTANPPVEVPARYRDELDELLANGW